MDLNLVRHHVVEKILAAEVKLSPFMHFTVDNLLPAGLYSKMLDELPPRALYKDFFHYDSRLADGSATRKFFYLERESSMSQLTPHARSFWKDIHGIFDSAAFNQAIKEKFSLPGDSRKTVRLVHDVAGYQIDVHPDTEVKLFTGILYMPQTDNHPEMGTKLHEQDYKHALTIPYLPNKFFAFKRSWDSFHSVDTVPHGLTRDGLLLFWATDRVMEDE